MYWLKANETSIWFVCCRQILWNMAANKMHIILYFLIYLVHLFQPKTLVCVNKKGSIIHPHWIRLVWKLKSLQKKGGQLNTSTTIEIRFCYNTIQFLVNFRSGGKEVWIWHKSGFFKSEVPSLDWQLDRYFYNYSCVLFNREQH